MADAELILKVGQVEMQARGSQEWVSEQRKIFHDDYLAGRSDLVAKTSSTVGDTPDERAVGGSNPPAVDRWMKQNSLTNQQIDEVFDRAGNAPELILGKAPGNKGVVQVVNLYILAGVRALLATGEAAFQDKEARALCEKFGCFDSKHHAEYLKSMGSKILGSKDQGWRLTAPLLNAGADLIKSISSA